MPLARAFGVHEGLFVYEHPGKDADRHAVGDHGADRVRLTRKHDSR
jgi:hypothetical protein